MLNTQIEAEKCSYKALSVDEFKTEIDKDDVHLLDTRDPEHFRTAFIPQSLNLGLGNNFAPWMSRIFPDKNTKIALVCNVNHISQCEALLKELGFHHIVGYLKDGIESWKNSNYPIDSIKRLNIDEFSEICKKANNVIDVRRDVEYFSQHVKGAENISLDNLIEEKQAFAKEACVLYCQGGYRSMIVASLLKQKGFHDVMDVEGGFSEIIEHDIELTDYKCPTTFNQ